MLDNTENDKWGYINKIGEEVIPPYYCDCWNFQANRLAMVCLSAEHLISKLINQ